MLKMQRDLAVVINNDNEISLHFKPMRLIFMNYSV
jgi:hypothetical protein